MTRIEDVVLFLVFLVVIVGLAGLRATKGGPQ